MRQWFEHEFNLVKDRQMRGNRRGARYIHEWSAGGRPLRVRALRLVAVLLVIGATVRVVFRHFQVFLPHLRQWSRVSAQRLRRIGSVDAVFVELLDPLRSVQRLDAKALLDVVDEVL